MITKEIVAEIKQQINIVDIIGESVSLTKAGRNYLGLCPFHGEKTPSFNVVEDKQFYHCFGCGRSGDVFSFIQELRGWTFQESVSYLAEKAGVILETGTFSPSARSQKPSPYQALYAIHEETSKFYHAYLMTTKMGEAARHYLHERGLSDEVLRTFRIGLSPNREQILYDRLSQDFHEKDLLDSGIFNASDQNRMYDAFQGRIIFPLTDESGRVLGFSGRKWTPEDLANPQLAKYKNSRSTRIFNKSYELYHLDVAKPIVSKQKEVYLMEGFMDVIAAHRAGIDNAVASMGTALSPEHVQHLQKFTKKVILTYDGDAAGKAATEKALQLLKPFEVEIVSLPGGMDPDEYLQVNSAEDLEKVLTQSRISPVEFLMNYWKPDNIDNLQMQIQFVDQMAPLIAQTRSMTAQNSYIYKLADLLPDFDYQQVETAVNHVRLAHRASQESEGESTRFVQHQPFQVARPKISNLVRTENHLLYRMTEHRYLLNEYRNRPDFSFVIPEIQRLFELLKEHGEITSFELSKESPEVQQAWYQILEEKLPPEMSEEELSELESNHAKELLKRSNREVSKAIREQAHVGNDDGALDALEALISQKRKME